ncbi:MAG TPA: VOC family protein [Candidatus Limnocylindria bacterium]|nr:VOC family protein [Candidatus Limnocylindria bacterium]
MQVTHIRLLVSDYLGCLRFWRDTVGLRLVYGDESGTYASFETGPTRLSIYSAAEMAEVVPLILPALDAPDRSLVQLDVERVDATVELLRERGIAVTPASDQAAWGIRVAHFRDPEGNLFELAERLPDST